MVLTVPHIFIPASVHFLMQRSASFQYTGRVVPELAKNHHQTSIGANPFLLELDGPINGALPDGNGRDTYVIQVNPFLFTALFKPFASQMGQNLLGIAKLRH
jgi:hypothetical protein